MTSNDADLVMVPACGVVEETMSLKDRGLHRSFCGWIQPVECKCGPTDGHNEDDGAAYAILPRKHDFSPVFGRIDSMSISTLIML
jgi:hypothetical protein